MGEEESVDFIALIFFKDVLQIKEGRDVLSQISANYSAFKNIKVTPTLTSSESGSFGQRWKCHTNLIGCCRGHLQDLLEICWKFHYSSSSCLTGFGTGRSRACCGSHSVRLQEEARLEGLHGQKTEGVFLSQTLQGRGLQQGDTQRCQPTKTQGQAQSTRQEGRRRLLGKTGAWRLHVDHLDAVQVGLVDLIICWTGLYLVEKSRIC